ncbi:selenocysteine-specific translation elongation factor [Lottiidibacillus patelloidae]|uniref:Selenocysteine-specific elongation factor n=1 Tax=Lottiidibacillus patelloidae TaxID=2670334 RepID=A0A263BT11_9BACI|nr:selenocysteine-specific translation elongation factor [Lottiidibacillus patelloidae]OZM56316.1 selenocysteine-specific translation elongation factor [Lottiidibacillus patelloidae]
MSQRFYTVGMAGHIDHGKTSLTKALTNVDTDRLKEEKERKITIELGYAPFDLGELKASIIDVPGHERFIRQMIAGVAGIDLVLLVIAADEGVMPQTREHLQILTYLGIKEGIIVVTKADKVEEDFLPLVKDDIASVVRNTIFEKSDVVFVDSISHKGIDVLKSKIKAKLEDIPVRSSIGDFRFPIDQVFTLQGKGTIVRGTVYEGSVSVGQQLQVLPSEKAVKVKNIHVHNQEVEKAFAGQRAAINVSIAREEIERGDVLASSLAIPHTNTLDIVLTSSDELELPLKQRTPIKFHSGTAEVMGKIVFFDRNELKATEEEVLCQVRLDEPIVIKRGDRFVLRRPSPTETIGGGWVIDPYGDKYRFGQDTVKMLKQNMEGTPKERVLSVLNEEIVSIKETLTQLTSIAGEELDQLLTTLLKEKDVICYDDKFFTSKQIYNQLVEDINKVLAIYHENHPMRYGMNKAEIISTLHYPKRLIEVIIEELIDNGELQKTHQYISTTSHLPKVPKQWDTRVANVVTTIKEAGIQVEKWDSYLSNQQIPVSMHQELKRYVLETSQLIELEENMLVHRSSYNLAVQTLFESTSGNPFTVQDAKSVLNLSRKGIIPLLESLDKLAITKRIDNERHWIKRPVKNEQQRAT